MASSNYKIIDITFSARQVTEIIENTNSSNSKGTPSDTPAGNITVRTTKLVMHVAYKLEEGLTLSNEYGVTSDLQDLVIVKISPEGLLTSIERKDIPDNLKTSDGIVSKAEGLINAKIASDAINAAERNYIDKTLTELKSVEVPEESSASLEDILSELSSL